MEPLVRIVMTTKNREKLLLRAVDSIRKQTVESWELICIDDMSSDSTWSILEGFRCMDTRIQIEETGGWPFSYIKQGYMLRARTPYVCILDDDDFWEPNYLRDSLGLLIALGSPMSYSNCYLVNEVGEVRLEDTSKGYPFPDVLPSLCVFRTDTFKELGAWDLDFFQHNGKVIHAEIDFYLKMLKEGMVIHIPKPLVWIYRTTTSMGSPRELSAHGNLKLMERWETELKRKSKYWAAFNCRVGINLEEAHMEGSRKYFTEAIKSSPTMLTAWAALICSFLGHRSFVRLYKWYRKLIGFDGKVIDKVVISKDGLW